MFGSHATTQSGSSGSIGSSRIGRSVPRDRTGSAGSNAVWSEEPTPTLAAAPEGLSARRVERWLDLPPGAWQKRRLYALRLRGRAFAHLGFQPGDLIVVEPGAREQAGSIIVARSAGEFVLRKVIRGSSSGRRLPTVLELPLRERSDPHSERVVGTVIGHLRSTGTGALRPVAPAPSRGRKRHRAQRQPAATPSTLRARPAFDSFLRTLDSWTEWIEARRHANAPAADLENWERLHASLGTLCDCISRTHNPDLRAALFGEAGALAATIHSVMRG